MKRFAPTLTAALLTLFTLTACNTTEADYSGTYESIDQLIDAIDNQTELGCEWTPRQFSTPDDRDERWDASLCKGGGALHHHRSSDRAQEWILDNLTEIGYTKTEIAMGDDWIFVGDHQQASMVRNGLSGRQPNIAARRATASPTPTGPAFIFSCRDEDWEGTGEFISPEEAWELAADERVSCDGDWQHSDESDAAERHDYSDLELEALEAAEYKKESLPLLYGMCAASYFGDYKEIMPWSEGQLSDLRGALILCPDHPERDVVEVRAAAAAAAAEEREQGKRFGNGTYRVGEDIQPGTYVVEVDEAFDGCYWQRLDASGNTIDNNFISSGFRAEVTIVASDHSFSSKRCGEWAKQ